MELSCRIELIYKTDEKQKLLELEQRKFENEFREKYGDKSWNESDIS